MDIAFIQETHLLENEIMKWKQDWVGDLVHSSYSSKRNGVAILFKKKLKIYILNQYKDEQGRIICVEVNIWS